MRKKTYTDFNCFLAGMWFVSLMLRYSELSRDDYWRRVKGWQVYEQGFWDLFTCEDPQSILDVNWFVYYAPTCALVVFIIRWLVKNHVFTFIKYLFK